LPASNTTLSTEEQFAVISRRLVLDFNTTVLTGAERSKAEQDQMTQVEKHMRVCLGIKEQFESAVTVASSEPILTEAAATIAQHIQTFRSCRALRNILQWPGLSKGDRGELIVCNITIDTLDSLMFKDRQLQSLIVNATSYFEALFGSKHYETIRNSLPSKLGHEDDNKTFAEIFKDARLYVTHFIKVYDYKSLSAEFLLKCLVRGVAIVCADNQRGVDIVLPMLYKNSLLKIENITCILIQSKNDPVFSTKPKRYLFDAMNPITLQVFNKSTTPLPVIRMVYALAAKASVVYVSMPGTRKQPSRKGKQKSNFGKNSYTSFDIWCGQATSQTFATIQREDNDAYKELLRLSRDVSDMFNPRDELLKDIVQSMYPLGMLQPGHCNSFYQATVDAAVTIQSEESEDDQMIELSEDEMEMDTDY